MTNIQEEIQALKQRIAELENRANSPQLEWPQESNDGLVAALRGSR